MRAKRKILVVEDSLVNRRMLCKILAQEYDTLEAENGRQALEFLGRYGRAISLIFLDIYMPVMDGYAFLSQMQTNPLYTAIPVIVATQSDGVEDEVTALTRGATDFISKPYKPQVILHRAKSIISLCESAALIDRMEYDQLTGVYSQAFFYQRVRQTLQQNPDKKYDILCSNVENFKFINEAFGMAVGDQVLRLVAREIQRTMGEDAIPGRLRADIFACMSEHRDTYSGEELGGVLDRIRHESGVSNFTMKWGVYAVVEAGIPVEQMCDRALLACASVKGLYARPVAWYDDTLRRQRLREKTITDSCETALREGQFQVWFQPKYNLRNMKVSGAEALVRWQHPTLGPLGPGEFIPLFEKNGFITQLDQYVWERTARCMRGWADQGLPLVPVSVNVSRTDIYHADLVDVLTGIRNKHGLAPFQLRLEITETAYTENHRQLSDAVTALREAGFLIEMDDFGSGYSSLNMLNELPIDILKLDLKFLQEGGGRVKRRSILSFVVSMARWLDLQVVAEGVEREEQIQKLRDAGCTYAQGYYFSAAVPPEEFQRFLKDADDSAEAENALADDEILEKTKVLEAAACHDYLTGLLNRRGLNEAMLAADLTRRNAAVFLFDMDDMKLCNDHYGHAGGDEMLRWFSQVLRSQTRTEDILARIGGDEFLVVMWGMPSAESARGKGERICRIFREEGPVSLEGYLSCSAGLAILQPGETIEDATARADQAMYRAKNIGKGMCCL